MQTKSSVRTLDVTPFGRTSVSKSNRHEGRVNAFFPAKHFGFVTFLNGYRSGQTLFYHAEDCLNGVAKKGDRVSFTLGQRNGREKAIHVVVTEKSVSSEVIFNVESHL